MSLLSPGRKLAKAVLGAMSKSSRKNPPVKKIGNRYPQSRKTSKI